MKEYKIHLVASNKYEGIKTLLEGIGEYQDKEIKASIVKWNYSFLALNHFLSSQLEAEPDILFMFDNAEYSKTDAATGKNVGHKKMLEVIRKAKINLKESRIVFILSQDKLRDKNLILELMKLDVQNFYFADMDNLESDEIKKWLFGLEKTFDDNKDYLESDEIKKLEPIIKYVDRVIEKDVIETEVIEKIINTSVGPTIIAVGGTKEGAGTTNLTINIAKYIKTIHKKVALVELNNKPVLKGLDIKGIDIIGQDYIGYLMDKPINLLNTINSDDYNCLVLDLGALYKFKNENECQYNERTAENSEYFYEMNRAHISILVHPGGGWNLKYFTPFLINKDISSRWKIALMHTNTVDKKIKEEFKNYYLAPFNLDINNEETIAFMEDMLKEIMTVSSKKTGVLNKLPFLKKRR